MQVGGGDVGQVGRPDHPHTQTGEPATCRRQVRNLKYRHVPAVAAAPLQVPARGGIRPCRRHDLHERAADREHRISQAELPHPRVTERLRPAKGPAQLSGHPIAVMRDQGHLAQARSGQHTPTIRGAHQPRQAPVKPQAPGHQRIPVWTDQRTAI